MHPWLWALYARGIRSEHLITEYHIRLRGGWECSDADSCESPVRRITLPISWTDDHKRRLRLARRFNRPPVDPQHQVLLLRLEEAPGIRSLTLNGQSAARVSPLESSHLIPLGGLPDRNLLVLEIELPGSREEGESEARAWGAISLVIRTVEPPSLL
jgi:hypothetical protein